MHHNSIRRLIINSFVSVPGKNRIQLNALPSRAHVAETNVQTASTLLTQLHQNTVNTRYSVGTLESMNENQKACELVMMNFKFGSRI